MRLAGDWRRGPCGLLAVGVLLGRLGGARVGWVEGGRWEAMGRLGRYGSVPANARNEWVCAALRAVPAFDFEARQAKRAPRLSTRAPLGTSNLQLSIDALRDASEAIRGSGMLAFCRDHTHIAALDFDGTWWRAASAQLFVRARRVIISPGGRPRRAPTELQQKIEAAGIRVLEYDDVVVPDRCATLMREAPVASAGIVGAGHSGLLAAKNLHENKVPRVVVLSNKPHLTFAEDRKGWTKHEGEGLKGPVADFARSRSVRVKQSPDNPVDLVPALCDENLEAVVFTWGFERNPLPSVTYLNNKISIKAHNVRNGRLAPGLHGVGLAFPESWTDPEGHTEPRVGFSISFLRYLNTVVDTAAQPIFNNNADDSTHTLIGDALNAAAAPKKSSS